MRLSDLPFVKLNADGSVASLWSLHPTGDYLKDRQTGMEYAEATIRLLKVQGNLALFGWIIRGFGENPEYSATEGGFCHCIALNALS